MVAKDVRNVEQLRADLELCGYAVVKVGERFRVTHPDGGGLSYIPARLNDKHLRPQIKRLHSEVGFDPDEPERIRERQRQSRFAESLRVTHAAEARAANMRKANDASQPGLAAPHREESAIPPRSTTATRKVAAPAVKPATKAAPKKAVTAKKPASNIEVKPVSLYEKLYAEAIVIPGGTERVVRTELDGFQAAELAGLNNFWDPKSEPIPGVRSNRPVAAGTVDKYAEDMVPSDGSPSRWKKTVQSVAFDWNDDMHDGQQRMLALQAAAMRDPDYTMPVTIWFGVDPDTFDVWDTGRSRSDMDMLAMDRVKNRNYTKAAAAMVIRFQAGQDWRLSLSPVRTRTWIRQNPLIHESVLLGVRTAATKRKPGVDIVASSLAAAHFLFTTALPDRMEALTTDPLDMFFTGLRTGADLRSNDPRLALRNWGRKNRTDKDSVFQLAVVIKMINAFLTGTNATYPKFTPLTEAFPEPLAEWEPSFKLAFGLRHQILAADQVEA